MSAAVLSAAARLEAVLTRENAALQALDFPASALLLPEKLAAAAALSGVATGASGPDVSAAAGRLRGLGNENRRLLERAMRVQGRVIEVVARAARQSQPAAPRYGARGTLPPEAGGAALLLQA